MTLDLKQPEARQVLKTLLGTSDIFIHNLAPGAVDRLGFDAGALRRECPRLIICQVTGYGTSGPYRDRRAYDLLVQSETAVLSITGTQETPSKVGISIADIAGGMYAYTGLLTGLLTRAQTGHGLAMEVSLFDALGEWMGYPLYYATYGGTAPRQRTRTEPRHHRAIRTVCGRRREGRLPRHPESRNGRASVATSSKLPGSSTIRVSRRIPCRIEHRVELERITGRALRNAVSDDLTRAARSGADRQSRMNTVDEFADHPQLVDRGRWRHDRFSGRIASGATACR